jgi:hypothetical protein
MLSLTRWSVCGVSMDASLRWHDGVYSYPFLSAAWAAARRAIGTRYGDAET